MKNKLSIFGSVVLLIFIILAIFLTFTFAQIFGGIDDSAVTDFQVNPDDSAAVTVEWNGSPAVIADELLGKVQFSNAYPNPATDYLTLYVGEMQGDAVQVMVFDEVGRQLMIRNYTIEEGQTEVYMDISALKEGILTIVTESQGGRSAFRIIKQ